MYMWWLQTLPNKIQKDFDTNDSISFTGPKSKDDVIKSVKASQPSIFLTAGILWINLTAANQASELEVKVCLSKWSAGFGLETQTLGLVGLDLIARSWHWLVTCKTLTLPHLASVVQAPLSFMSFYNSTVHLSVCPDWRGCCVILRPLFSVNTVVTFEYCDYCYKRQQSQQNSWVWWFFSCHFVFSGKAGSSRRSRTERLSGNMMMMMMMNHY